MSFLKKHLYLIGIGWFLSPSIAAAFCPLCVIATGAGVGLARWLGIDDIIIGLWLGGFSLSLSLFLNNLLVKMGRRIRFQSVLIFLAFTGLNFFLLYFGGFFGISSKIFGINKLVFGFALGTLLLLLVPRIDKFLRKLNDGKIFISHQKMLTAIILLLIFSLVFYFLI